MKKYLAFKIILFFSMNAYSMDFNARLTCAINAAIEYDIPADMLLAISTIENGEPNVAIQNNNGTYDYGIMQINSVYLKDLKEKYNIVVTPEEVSAIGCLSFELAAFKVSEHLKNDTGSFLERIAMYHSRSEDRNRNYQTKLITHSAEWRQFLTKEENGYHTYLWIDKYQKNRSHK